MSFPEAGFAMIPTDFIRKYIRFYISKYLISTKRVGMRI